MFEPLHPLPPGRVLEAVHQTLGIVRHYTPYPAEERERYARAKARVAGDHETDLALALIEEIERAEGAPLAEIDPDMVEHYLGYLRNYAFKRDSEGRPPETRSVPGGRWRPCGGPGREASLSAPEPDAPPRPWDFLSRL